jgi:hypothetical protein
MNRALDLRVVRTLLAAAIGAAPVSLGACTPKIGDKCVLSTDCSIQGNRICDTAQPNGYCTVINCAANSCPDQAACVMFEPQVPGCPYNDYASPSRTGRTRCMAQCQQDSDCRQSDGYVCVDPRQKPWLGQIIDDAQTQHVCIVAPKISSAPGSGVGPAPVCVAGTGFVDAGGDAGAEAGNDAAQAADGGNEAAADGANEAAADGGSEAAADAMSDAALDAGSVDAPGAE